MVQRLLPWRSPRGRAQTGVYCVLLFPEGADSRWFDKPPPPGTRIRSRGAVRNSRRVWIVDEVLQSGRNTYTVFCVGRREYLGRLRHGSGRESDLADELLERARGAGGTDSQRRLGWLRWSGGRSVNRELGPSGPLVDYLMRDKASTDG